MKTILLFILALSCNACSQHAVYSAIHERDRQLCLQQGRSDCPSHESYREYKEHRDEAIQK